MPILWNGNRIYFAIVICNTSVQSAQMLMSDRGSHYGKKVLHSYLNASSIFS